MNQYYLTMFMMCALVSSIIPLSSYAQGELTFEQNEKLHAIAPFRVGLEQKQGNFRQVYAGTGADLNLDFYVINKGTQPDQYSIEASSHIQTGKPDYASLKWDDPIINPSSVILQPGEKQKISVTVSIPSSATAGTTAEYSFTVTGKGSKDGIGDSINIITPPQ